MASNSRRQDGQLTRRAVLAAGGTLGVAGLAGCLDTLEGLVGDAAADLVNTVATPAAFYGGADAPAGSRAESDHTVEYVPATVSGGGLESSVGLPAYVTTSLVQAQNHNSSRSNRTSAVRSDPDADGDGLADVLELERKLSTQATEASNSISKRSARTGRLALEDIVATIDAIQAELERCTTDVCATVRENADIRKQTTRTAIDAVDTGDWEQAEASVERVREIVAGDIRRLEDALDADSDGDGLDDGSELAAYLDGEATIGERFVFAVPGASFGDERLADELTPDRVLQYLTGRADSSGDSSQGTVYAWGSNEPRLAAEIDWPFSTGTGPYNPNEQLLALGYKGEGLNNATVSLDVRGSIDPDDDGDGVDTAADAVSIGGGNVSRNDGDGPLSWGNERVAGDVSVSPTVVLSVAARPEDCPEPMPALLFVRRIRHGEQLVFAGGWIVDDNALYGNAVTMFVAEDVPELSAVAHDRSVEEMRRTITSGLTRERSRLGSLAYDGELNEAALAFLPPAHRDGRVRADLLERVRQRVGRRNPQTGKAIAIPLRDGPAGPDEESLQVTVVPIDCPIVQISLADGCKDCEECKCVTNLVPAVNTISSR
ncbi:hypothetical protein [Halapricum hydrolyticum]|uniref:Uncharacterized protein n=1 Tax=Halapricum hydrolyticum TaxID=2979991 RepID=A0AAE3LFH4_9EURY|nr:hypothetical protein [Halapricum hydrolyticum]MCU4718836.1 hypothetical protein [Halapricum hydrolyticum]MCU4727756.1 hypothetical protein [Halapricum hydrolyticum]